MPEMNPRREQGGFNITWHTQENPSDCGPMAVLNALIRINFPNRPTSVQAVRNFVAESREREGQSALARVGGDVRTSGWLSSFDIQKYLLSLPMPAEVLSSKPDMEEVKEELRADPNKFFILATGNHFKVVRYTGEGENFEILDSLQSGPQAVSKERAYELLDQSVGLTGVLAG